ncbi:unnamed protein product [Haemonchus placei]|uniref:Aquaporin n=1 Tax=Haemonchus placei TaxID=6290 RepID=A0A0N4WTZ2_HAEPC|nr:unnamed protein product [Haemonchus placei]
MRVWIASLVFYGFVFAVCELLRYFIVRFMSKRLSTDLLLEFVGTLQICTPMFDVGTVLETYGLFGIFVEITVIELANTYFQRDAIANPCPIVTSCYRRSKAFRRAIYVLLTQMLAGYLSFHLARAFWRLNIHPVHAELLAAEHCTADLTIAITTGCLVEGGATFLGKAFNKYVGDYIDDYWTCNFVACVFSGFICALGIKYTGMYANPLVAWACTFNCEGLTHAGHLMVYWLSPLIGW